MNKLSVVLIGAAMALAHGAQAAELRVLAGGAMTAVWAEVKPKFEQASGHKLDIFFGTTPNLIKEATSGKPFDVGIVPVEVTQDAAARAKFAAGPTLDVARVGLGVAVRAGAAKPDISTPDALKATLLKAQSVASIPASATGYSIAKVFDRLGITEAMKAKMKATADAGGGGRGRRQGRGRPRSVPNERADRARARRGRSVPGRSPARRGVHGGTCFRNEGRRCRQGADRLSQVA